MNVTDASECECGHIYDEHPDEGCSVDDCRCSNFDLAEVSS